MLIINPGTDASRETVQEDLARAGLRRYMHDLRTIQGQDVKEEITESGPSGQYMEGYWSYTITVDGSEFEVDVAGVPLEKLVWYESGHPDNLGGLLDVYRLYVDGSSWAWKFALNMCKTYDDE